MKRICGGVFTALMFKLEDWQSSRVQVENMLSNFSPCVQSVPTEPQPQSHSRQEGTGRGGGRHC